jgi:predicted enzyme related to lactoylglutathione lyase
MQAPPFNSQITFCYTDDLEGTAAWYERVFGWEVAIDQGKCRIYRVAGQSFLGICERSSVGINHDDVILTFVTDEVDAWYDRLQSLGAIVIDKPQTNEQFGIYHFFARDPNGYQIEIQRFLSPQARAVCHQPAL